MIENWGHPDLEKKYIADKGDGSAMDVGPTGNDGIIGWYVPPWLAEEHPDILDWKNLNEYADEFETSESGDKGQLLGGDPSYVQRRGDGQQPRPRLQGGLLRQRGREHPGLPAGGGEQGVPDRLLLRAAVVLRRGPAGEGAVPPYEEGCQHDPEKVDCDYPETVLKKIVSTSWVDEVVRRRAGQNFEWTNDDQNVVAQYISDEGMSPEDAAARWVEENPDKVDAWLP